MPSVSGKIIEFRSYEVDLRRGELRANGQPIEVEPQVFDLIAYMASNPGRVHSRDEIIEGVWDGRIVSDSAISTRINAARKALGDDGKSQHTIKTVSRKGFIFLPETRVKSSAEILGPTNSVERAEKQPNEVQQKPSIMVLPFENLSGDTEQSFFSDGIADDIITDLSRYEELLVIARQSAFTFRDRNDEAFEFSKKRNVSFLLEGSVRRASNRVRVAVRLVDVATRETVWAERFNRDISDILDVQEEVATVIVNMLIGHVSLLHIKRQKMSGQHMIGAYDHMLRAQQHIWTFSREGTALARQEASKAIALNPGLARAHAILGWAHHTEASNSWSAPGAGTFDIAIACSKSAIAADTNEPWGHCVLGFSLWWRDRGRNFSRGLEEVKLAVRLNPSNAHFRMIVGATLAYMGRGSEALSEIDTAIRFNPIFPGLYLVHRARACFVDGRFEEALMDVERAATEMPTHTNVLALLAACHEKLGQHRQAAKVVSDLRSTNPDYTLDFVRRTIPFAEEKHREAMCSLLWKAGLLN